jgi:acyl phosphate:glycerol-3-phosphate acyltransferase
MEANALIGPLLALLGAYGLGSIPFGYLAGRICRKDLRREGSGNIGATNAFRVLGKGWGLSVFALDFAKGLLAVELFGIFVSNAEGWLLAAGITAILGHNFPVWLGFRGGKGIATSAGVIAALYPPWYFLVVLALWVGLFFSTRYVSVASLGAAVALITGGLTGIFFGFFSGLLGGVSVVIGLLGMWRHRSNIARLRAGTEPRFSRKSPSKESNESATPTGSTNPTP